MTAKALAHFHRDHLYPRLVRVLGDPKPIQHLRRRILPLAHGEVLEIGFGTGTNLSYYDPERVTRLYALEPNGRMIQMSERHPVRADFDIRYLDVPGERLPLGDGSVDSVVSTFTLCTISGVTDAVREIARVLRADGRLIFLENTASPDPPVRLWQRLWAPIHYRVFAGLDLTRNVPSYLEAGGFSFEHIENRLPCAVSEVLGVLLLGNRNLPQLSRTALVLSGCPPVLHRRRQSLAARDTALRISNPSWCEPLSN